MQLNEVNNKEHCLVSPSSQQCQHIIYPHVLEFHVLMVCSVVYHMYRRNFSGNFVVAAHHPGSSPPTLFPPPLSTVSILWGCIFPLLWGGSRLGCQDIPAMGAVFIWELAANSGSSWMSEAPNLHFSDAVVNNLYIIYYSSWMHPERKGWRIIVCTLFEDRVWHNLIQM